MTRPKPAKMFLSPIKVTARSPDNRIISLEMKVATVGEVSVLTLTYSSYGAAKSARAALIAAGNVYAVSSSVLWRAVAESIQPASRYD